MRGQFTVANLQCSQHVRVPRDLCTVNFTCNSSSCVHQVTGSLKIFPRNLIANYKFKEMQFILLTNYESFNHRRPKQGVGRFPFPIQTHPGQPQPSKFKRKTSNETKKEILDSFAESSLRWVCSSISLTA